MSSISYKNTKVTILTPTYNRAHTLPRLYESLTRQSDKRFQWFIVDDGSHDNTKNVVNNFLQDDFLIRYIYKENGGKHTAINKGVKYIDTEYTFIVDSDDYLQDDAIEMVNKWVEDILSLAGFAGVAGTRVKNDKNYSLIGEFPDKCEYIDCLNSERRQKKLMGDKAEIYKTLLLRQNVFPEYKDEKFMPESVVWNKFSIMGLKVRWHKKGIIVCEYLDDGITSYMKKISHFNYNFKVYSNDFDISLKALKFPYNYSSGSVFYAKCMATGKTKKCLDEFDITYPEKIMIKLLGKIRHRMRRY